ncbi:Hsp70 family protein [Gordonia sp. ABSL1-1]|uniref:Hsp70 family protein n=1 Tax=Gordonia sp. ABSL1-1 TaxID=3053923 RepID=UPI0025729DCD|nr:Hsp70 family protein [Gordonia sp. ABSL1-1]MDL9937180.1 Hsp70 family protein [Gordonia sp. ABSL1-1]
MGVSAGTGMIHFVLFTRDEVGRHVLDSRVIDVDESDGLDTAGRVNAGIDLVLGAARDQGLRVGPIGVTARTAGQRRRLRSQGAGPRRQIGLIAEDEATVVHLGETGEIDRFDSVVVVDCGDTGMTLFSVEPSSERITDVQRLSVLSGRDLDRALVERVLADRADSTTPSGGRAGKGALLSACRTAKEEIPYEQRGTAVPAVTFTAGSRRVTLTSTMVEQAAAPMVDEARESLRRYLSDAIDAGRRPQAVVFVGGMANLPFVREMAADLDVEVVAPDAPELVAATGVAIAAQRGVSPTTRLTFIGGRRSREWLSATPLAVAGVVIAALLLTIYAVTSSLTRSEVSDAPRTMPSPMPASSLGANSSLLAPSTEQPVNTVPPVSTTPPPTPASSTSDNPGWVEPPSWATTELPPTTAPSTSTRTLVPFPLPSLPFPGGTTPTIPPELLPPGLIPPTGSTTLRPTRAPLADGRTAPSTLARPRGVTPPTQRQTPERVPGQSSPRVVDPERGVKPEAGPAPSVAPAR